MWWHVFSLAPRLMVNRLLYGRYLDVFITHASPWGIHDQPDLPHQGIKAFRWFDRVFTPAYHFHGHIHVYRPDTSLETKFNHTWVINTFGYRLTHIQPGKKDLDRVESPIHNT
jgi:Icc-related predicted phosphoesterase